VCSIVCLISRSDPRLRCLSTGVALHDDRVQTSVSGRGGTPDICEEFPATETPPSRQTTIQQPTETGGATLATAQSAQSESSRMRYGIFAVNPSKAVSQSAPTGPLVSPGQTPLTPLIVLVV